MTEQKTKKIEEQIDGTTTASKVATAPKQTTNCSDHVSRTKVLEAIESTMARYKGKVVLAMSEVSDIINAITTAVKE